MTTMFNRVRNAALITLALGTIVAGAAPAQALSLKQLPEMGSSTDHHDCDSRREVKYFFQEDYHLKNVSVSKTHDYYIYKVSALAPAPEEEAEALVLKDKSSDYVRYVFLWDACEHEFVEWIRPSREPVEFQ